MAFEQWPDRYFNKRVKGYWGSYEDHERAIEESRDGAVREIMNALGFDGIEALFLRAEAPQVVGAVLARVSADRYIAEVLPRQISRGDKGLNLTLGFISARYYKDGWTWVDGVMSHCNTDNERAWILLAALPFDSEDAAYFRRGCG